jgi:hypothetical protein
MPEKTVITQKELVISSHSLLGADVGIFGFLKNARNWGLTELTDAAEMLGVHIMFEPLRKGFSKAREDIDATTPNDPRLQQIGYLSEQARSEAKLGDYLNARLPFIAFYALLEEGRFSPQSMLSLIELENKLSQAHDSESFPVRIYQSRRSEGVSDASVYEPLLKQKILALNLQPVIENLMFSTKHIHDKKRRSASIVQKITDGVEAYDVIGMELVLLSLLSIKELSVDVELLTQITKDLLSARNGRNSELALVQAVSIQPNRVDLERNTSLRTMQQVIDVVAEHFPGLITYSPGEGNTHEEIANLKSKFQIK